MEEILKKLLRKWFYHNIEMCKNKDKLFSIMNDKEVIDYTGELRINIERVMEETINQLKELLDDGINEIEFDLNLKFDDIVEEKEIQIQADEIGISIGDVNKDEWNTDVRYNKVVHCVESSICDNDDCMHKKPHIFSEECVKSCDKYIGKKIECEQR